MNTNCYKKEEGWRQSNKPKMNWLKRRRNSSSLKTLINLKLKKMRRISPGEGDDH